MAYKNNFDICKYVYEFDFETCQYVYEYVAKPNLGVMDFLLHRINDQEFIDFFLLPKKKL